MILCRAPRHPPGEEGVVKWVGINFHLFLSLLSHIGGEATYIVKMSEWVSGWVSGWVSDSNNRIPILIRFLPDVHCATCSLFRSTIGDGKHLTIIFRMTHEKQSFSLQKYLIRCDWRILKTYRKTFFFEGGVFYCVNQRIMPSRSEDTFFFHFLPLHYKRW